MRINNNKAFTLVEVFLGLVIFSIIGLTLYNTFSGGIELNQRSKQMNKTYREARWTFGQIEKDLELVTAYDFSNSYPDLLAFNGENDEISFLIRAEQGLEMIRYRLNEPEISSVHKVIIGERTKKNKAITTKYEEKQDLKFLTREILPIIDYMEGSGDNWQEPDIYSTRVKESGLKFQYADRDPENDDAITWKDIWSEDYLPVGVRVEIDYVDEQLGTLKLKRDILLLAGYWSKKGVSSQ